METEKDPFEAVRAMMHENLDKVGSATQSYLDIFEKTMRGLPGANQEQIGTFKAYIERQVAANETSGRSFWAPRIFRRPSVFRSSTFGPN